MDAQKARKLAEQAIAAVNISHGPERVADATLVGMDDNGYWVTDNGEEVNHLTSVQAIEIIVENLTA